MYVTVCNRKLKYNPKLKLLLKILATQTNTGLCEGFGPQTPRDISNAAGTNLADFAYAPPASEMNLCNIHTHTNAEHKGPGFEVFAGEGASGGYQCNETEALTAAETAPYDGKAYYKAVKPGDTIEVHWVHSTPRLRVEAQAFLVVNDPSALDFTDFDYVGAPTNGLHRAKAIPSNTGRPVKFRGSTTKVDIGSLHKWAKEGNVFNESKSHGVRALVTAPELLSPIR